MEQVLLLHNSTKIWGKGGKCPLSVQLFPPALKSIYLIHPRVCIKNVTTCYFYLMHENSIYLATSIRNRLGLGF